LTRRQILVPFNNAVEKSKRRELETEFQPELNALTQYLLSIPDETVTQVLRNASDNPELSQHTLEQQIATNTIAGWLNECVIRDANAKTSIGSDREDITTLFGNYVNWCRKSGNYIPSLRNFSPELLDFCNSTMRWEDIKKVRNNKGVCIYGLRLRELGKDDDILSPIISVEPKLHSEG
jgi:putative DNA primase/helicase